MLDSHWMPFATPETAERMKQTVSTTMMRDEQHVAGLADAGDDLEAGADLQGAEAERGRGAEERREDREDVDDAPAGPLARFSRSSGAKAELMSSERPLRKTP